jgi:hypothetical protein
MNQNLSHVNHVETSPRQLQAPVCSIQREQRQFLRGPTTDDTLTFPTELRERTYGNYVSENRLTLGNSVSADRLVLKSGVGRLWRSYNSMP